MYCLLSRVALGNIAGIVLFVFLFYLNWYDMCLLLTPFSCCYIPFAYAVNFISYNIYLPSGLWLNELITDHPFSIICAWIFFRPSFIANLYIAIIDIFSDAAPANPLVCVILYVFLAWISESYVLDHWVEVNWEVLNKGLMWRPFDILAICMLNSFTKQSFCEQWNIRWNKIRWT
jgi:hypothetical protein